MPINNDMTEICAYCLRVFTAFWEGGEVWATSIPASPIGDGLWLCDEHAFSDEYISHLKRRIKLMLPTLNVSG